MSSYVIDLEVQERTVHCVFLGSPSGAGYAILEFDCCLRSDQYQCAQGRWFHLILFCSSSSFGRRYVRLLCSISPGIGMFHSSMRTPNPFNFELNLAFSACNAVILYPIALTLVKSCIDAEDLSAYASRYAGEIGHADRYHIDKEFEFRIFLNRNIDLLSLKNPDKPIILLTDGGRRDHAFTLYQKYEVNASTISIHMEEYICAFAFVFCLFFFNQFTQANRKRLLGLKDCESVN